MLRKTAKIFFISAALIALLAFAMIWISQRETALQWLVNEIIQGINKRDNGELSIQGVSGSLSGISKIDMLTYQSENIRINAQDIEINWKSYLLPLQIRSIRVKQANVFYQYTNAKPTFPENLPLPLKIDVELAIIDQITIEINKTNLSFNQVKFSMRSTAKEHNFLLQQAYSSWGLLSGYLQIATIPPFKLKSDLSLKNLNLAQLGKFPSTQLNSTIQITGQLLTPRYTHVIFKIQDSFFNHSPLMGHGKFFVRSKRIQETDIHLSLADNIFNVQGDFGSSGDVLNWNIDAQQLNQFHTSYNGTLQASGTLVGTQESPSLNFILHAKNLKLPGNYRIQSLQGQGKLNEENFSADLNLAQLQNEVGGLKTVSARVNGTRAQHRAHFNAIRKSKNSDLSLQLELMGGLNRNNSWTGSLVQLRNRGTHTIDLLAPAPITIGRSSQSIKNARFQVNSGQILIEEFTQQEGGIRSLGNAKNMPLAPWLIFFPNSRIVKTSLTFAANWNLSINNVMNGSLSIQREQGDIWLATESQKALGINQLLFNAQIAHNRTDARLQFASQAVGNALIRVVTVLNKQNQRWGIKGAAPLTASAQVNLSSLAWLPVVRNQKAVIDGQMELNLTVRGTLASPNMTGKIKGTQLSITFLNQGIALQRGYFSGDFQDDKIIINELVFPGEQGELRATGMLSLKENIPLVQLDVELSQFSVLYIPEWELIASGKGKVLMRASSIQVEGNIKVDRALIQLSNIKNITLSNDIIITGQASSLNRARLPLQLHMALVVNLGEVFFIQGQGFEARLKGALTLGMEDSALQAMGTLNIVEGSYTGYVRPLKVEQGTLTFDGALANPALFILAMNRNQPVEAGVRVTGFVQNPKITLVSEPNVPDNEKLSWLVLGHGSANSSGDELSLLGTAASTLLAPGQGLPLQIRLARSLGVDEIGLTGAGGLESAMITVGKRLSSRLYFTLERSIQGVDTLAKLRYQLSPRWSLQTSTGTDNAVDLFYTLSFD